MVHSLLTINRLDLIAIGFMHTGMQSLQPGSYLQAQIIPAPESIKPESAKVLEIFISFVSEDRKMQEKLQKYLDVMQRHLKETRDLDIEIWHSDKIIAGQNWKEKIEKHLSQAHIILLLVSNDFLWSKLCTEIQIRPAISRHIVGRACVIPIIFRACHWQNEPFGNLRALPTDGKPVAKWANKDDAYYNIVDGIVEAIDTLLSQSPTSH